MIDLNDFAKNIKISDEAKHMQLCKSISQYDFIHSEMHAKFFSAKMTYFYIFARPKSGI